MLLSSPEQGDNYRGFLLSIFIGIVFYFAIFGTEIINPANIAWLSHGDTAQAYLGWEFFRNTPWRFPVIGLTPDFGMEVSNAVVYSDSNPLLAIIFKIFNSYLPADFQYFGIWLLGCCVLQAIFAWKIIRLYSESIVIKLAGTLLLMFIPAWINRIYHINLMANFFILAAAYLTLNPKHRENALKWGILICFSILVHLYLSLMVCVFWGSIMLFRAIKDIKKAPKMILFEMVPIFVCVALLAYVTGYFSVSHGVAAQGFGAYRANLLSPVLANGWSLLINTHSYYPTEGEGFNFLGLGVIFLLLLNVRSVVRYFTASKVKQHGAVIFAVAFLFIYSLSNQIGIGPYVVHYPLPDFVLKICAIFRASGRLMWPVTYFLIIFLVVRTIKNNSRSTAGFLLAFCAFVQIVDTSSGWVAIHKQYSASEQPDWTPHLKNAFWRDAVAKYKYIRWVPFDNSSEKYWKELSYYASKGNKATDAVYMARFDSKKAGEMNQAVLESLLEGNYQKDTLYVMDRDWSSLFNLRPQDLYAKIDGVYVLAPGDAACAACEVVQPKNTVESFFDFREQGKNTLLLADGWSVQEPWGVWSSNRETAITLPIKPGAHKITLAYNPFISSKTPVQHVIVTLEGKTLAEFSSADGAGATQEIALPHALIQGRKTVSLHFELPDAIIPLNAGLGMDSRMLAIGIKSINVE